MLFSDTVHKKYYIHSAGTAKVEPGCHGEQVEAEHILPDAGQSLVISYI